jgi:cell division protein FtsQ
MRLKSARKTKKKYILKIIMQSLIGALRNAEPKRICSVILMVIALVQFKIYGNDFVQAGNEIVNHYTNYLGLELENIYVTGHSNVDKVAISEIIKPYYKKSIFAVDIISLKNEMEKLEWVHNVAIQRAIPSTLHIQIIEQKPMAIWQNNAQLFLVDVDGRIITAKDIHKYSNLPILVGDGALLNYKNLAECLAIDGNLSENISALIRVSERRWNVRFKQNIEIKLPEHGFKNAWHYVIGLNKRKMLFDNNITVLDLRIQDRVFIKYKQDIDQVVKNNI